MPLSSRINSIICIVATLLFSGCSQNIESNKQALKQDANAFCDIHEAKHWKDISPQTSIADFNEITLERVHKVLKTNEFNKLLEDMKSVKFYRQMYPTAKSKIEKITGETWVCPAYEDFYSVKSSRDNTVSHESEPDIVITKEGKYLIQNKAVRLTTDSLKDALQIETKPRAKLIIKLETGVSDELLSPIFQALSPLGIENVSVMSDE